MRFDVPLMIGVSFLLLLLALDGAISRLDGALCVVGGVIYTVYSIVQSRRAGRQISEEQIPLPDGGVVQSTGRWWVQVLLITGGLALLVLGSNWLVDSAIIFARALGVSELVVGLTIVAIGTSLPETATSVIASLRGERDIAVGNVVGSNIMNILAVLGLTGVVSPQPIEVPHAALVFDIPVMLAVAVACLPIFFTGYCVARWEGILFLSYYIAYTLYLILNTTGHTLLPFFSTVMAVVVIPLTVITLAVLSIREFWKQPQALPSEPG